MATTTSTSTSSCRQNSVLSFWLLWLSSSWSRESSAADPNTLLVNKIFSYVNGSVPACEDYYKYVCGRWVDKLDMMGQIEHKVNLNLIKLMGELEQRENETKTNSLESKVLSFYQSCRKSARLNLSGRAFLELVPPNEQLLWPQLTDRWGDWAGNKFHWLETLARLRCYGLNNVLFKLEVQPDLFNNSNYVVYLKNPTFTQNNEHLTSRKVASWFLQHQGVDSAISRSLAPKVLQLHAAVREVAETEAEAGNGNENEPYQDLTLLQMEQQGAGNWVEYLSVVLGYNVSFDYRVRVDSVAYFVALMPLIQNWDREVIASYIMLQFSMHVQDETMDSDEPIACVQDLRRNMELATNLLYEQRFIGPDRLRKHNVELQKLFELLRKEFLHKLNENHLQLNQRQREMLKSKMLGMTVNIGKMPKKLNQTQFVAQFYEKLNLEDDADYAQKLLRLLKFRTERWFDHLNVSSLNMNSFFISSVWNKGASSAIYYMMRQNCIIVPYGMLQEPVFQDDLHDIFKVSLLGFMLSHVLMYGFVSKGLSFDAYGNAHLQSAKILNERKFVEAISCLDRRKTDDLDERAADIASIRLIYDIYFRNGSQFSQTQPKFTNVSLKQLFFINFAHLFCGKAEEQSLVDTETDELRLHQILINSAAFADAYRCHPDHDKMHPTLKCRLF